MTLDNWSDMIRPLMFEAPVGMCLALLFIGIATFVLFNLIVAVITDNAFESAQADTVMQAEYKRIADLKEAELLRTMFRDIDEDGSGALSRQEFLDVMDDPLFV